MAHRQLPGKETVVTKGLFRRVRCRFGLHSWVFNTVTDTAVRDGKLILTVTRSCRCRSELCETHHLWWTVCDVETRVIDIVFS